MKITKMIVLHSSKLLPSDILMKIYESKASVMVKETCFGILITGEPEDVKLAVTEARKLDPYGIFVKERAFLPGEQYRCRASRGGGAKPGFHHLETEDAMLSGISNALIAIDKGYIPQKPVQKKKLDVDKLKKVIEEYKE